MHIVRVIILLKALILLLGIAVPAQRLDASVESDDISGAYLSRLEHLQNLSATMVRTIDYTPPPFLIDRAPGPPLIGRFVTHGTVSFLSGRLRYEFALPEDNIEPELRNLVLLQDLRVFTPERVEQMGVVIGAEAPHGTIDSHARIPEELTLDYALGLRIHGMQEWLGPDLIDVMDWTAEESGEITATWTAPNGHRHLWRSDRKLGLSPSEYTVMDANGVVLVEHVMSDFHEVDNLMLPRTIVRRSFYMDRGERKVTRTIRIDVDDYIVGDPENTPERYRIAWPAGTHVRDLRTGTTFVVEPGEPRPISDAEIDRRRRERSARTPDATAAIVSGDGDKYGAEWYVVIAVTAVAGAVLLVIVLRKKGIDIGRG